MARPTRIPTWATDPVFTSGPASGRPTRLTIPDGARAQGYVPDTGFPGQYANQWNSEVADWLAWLGQRIQVDDELYFETPKEKKTLFTMGEGYPFLGSSDSEWSGYAGQYRQSAADGARWFIPFTGIPAGAQLVRIEFRAETNNAARPGSRAMFRLVRASASAVIDYAHDLTPGFGPATNPLYTVVTPPGISPPGPYAVEFPAFSGQVIAYTPPASHFFDDGYRYGLEVIAGSDFSSHVPDKFYPVVVTWNNPGPRSGG